MIKIELIKGKELDLKGYTLIEAFPGVGLVGPMAASYLIEKLGMKGIGYIESDAFPPIAAIHGAVPMFPARIYKNEKYKIVLFMSEFTIPPNAVNQLSEEMLAFTRKYGISKIVSVGGMPTQKPAESVYLASNDQSMVKKASGNEVKPIQEGVVAGVSAALLTKSGIYNIPAIDILVEVNAGFMDPKYAEKAINVLNKLLSVNIDLEELDKEAKVVEARIKEMVEKVKDTHDRYANTAVGAGPSMYA